MKLLTYITVLAVMVTLGLGAAAMARRPQSTIMADRPHRRAANDYAGVGILRC